MNFYYLLIILSIGFQAERGILDILSYFKLFKQLSQKGSNKSKEAKKTLYILIPVLNEKEIIEDTIFDILKIKNNHFKINIAILTTIQEKINNKNKKIFTTEEVVSNSMKSGKLLKFKDRIQIIQDPDINGKMATQLNNAISKLENIIDPATHYLALNADSKISFSTFEQLSILIDENKGKEFAFQQPCAFVKDMDVNAKQFTNAMSLYQSWYCLGHESRLVRNYSNKSINNWNKKNNTKLGVVVGHGSGMTLNINL
ncbi:MAG: hypothetical protein U9R14_04615 [Patescibacteria group bacterium]|nr:hypothetical protein [Patescibacteria group bacterium]